MAQIQLLILKAFIALLIASTPGTPDSQRQDAINQAISAVSQAQSFLATSSQQTPLNETGGAPVIPPIEVNSSSTPSSTASTESPKKLITLQEFLDTATITAGAYQENALNKDAYFIALFTSFNHKWWVEDGKVTWLPDGFYTDSLTGDFVCDQPTSPYRGKVYGLNMTGLFPNTNYSCLLTLTDKDGLSLDKRFVFNTYRQ